MQIRLTAVDRRILFMLSLGALGGATLVVTEAFATRGPLILVPYGGLLAATALFLVGGQVKPFGARFGLTFGTFMVASMVLYLYIAILANPAALGLAVWAHLWRIGVLVALGGILSAIVAQLTGTSETRCS